MNEFKNISSSDKLIIPKKAKEYIKCTPTEHDDSVYGQVYRLMKEKIDILKKETNDEAIISEILELTIHRRIKELIEGTVNLINAVIEKSSTKHPVKTMVFLDKSARNGAFLFSVMWRELEKIKAIPNIPKPEIRFMNIGKHSNNKHSSGAALALLGSVFNKEDFPDGGVLVVDDYIESGDSAKRAMKTLLDEYNIHVNAISQFHDISPWYHADSVGVTGIADSYTNEYDQIKFERLLTMDIQTALNLERIVNTPGARFQKLYQTVYAQLHDKTSNTDVQELERMEDLNIPKEDVEMLTDLIKKYGLKFDDGKYVEEFIRSAGGFLARPMKYKTNARLQKNNVIYRAFLKDMVKAYVSNRKVEPDNH